MDFASDEVLQNQVLSMLEAEFRTVSESIGHKTHEAETTEAQISQVAEKVKVLEEEKKQLMQMQNTSKIWAEDIKKLLETLGGITVTHASQGELQLTVLCHQNSRGTIERKVHLMVDTSAEHLVSAKVEDDDVYIEDIVEAATITHMQLPNVLRELKQRITVTEARKSALLKFPSTGRYVVKLDGPDCVSATWLNCVVILIETGLEWPESGPPLRVCSISELPPQQKSDCFQTLLATLNERLQSKSVDLESLLLMADEGLTRALPQN